MLVNAPKRSSDDHGNTAAKAANVYSIAIPDVRIHTDKKQRTKLFGKTDEAIASLAQFQIDSFRLAAGRSRTMLLGFSF